MQTTSQNKKSKCVGDYILDITIGEGAFGNVKVAENIQTKEKSAIKILEKSKLNDPEDIERVNREIKMIQTFDHPNIILIEEIFETIDNYYIVMEYCEKGDLFNYVVKQKLLSDEESAFFYYQLIEGLSYIHSQNIVHRDLKPENLLINHNGILKIIDFGLSNYYIKGGDYLSTPCGSPFYASPEMLRGEQYDGCKIDIWSTGIILYVMTCGRFPFDDRNNEELFNKIRKCNLKLPDFLTEDCKDLLSKILVSAPELRIDIDNIKRHPYFLKGKEIFNQKFGIEINSNININISNLKDNNNVNDSDNGNDLENGNGDNGNELDNVNANAISDENLDLIIDEGDDSNNVHNSETNISIGEGFYLVGRKFDDDQNPQEPNNRYKNKINNNLDDGYISARVRRHRNYYNINNDDSLFNDNSINQMKHEKNDLMNNKSALLKKVDINLSALFFDYEDDNHSMIKNNKEILPLNDDEYISENKFNTINFTDSNKKNLLNSNNNVKKSKIKTIECLLDFDFENMNNNVNAQNINKTIETNNYSKTKNELFSIKNCIIKKSRSRGKNIKISSRSKKENIFDNYLDNKNKKYLIKKIENIIKVDKAKNEKLITEFNKNNVICSSNKIMKKHIQNNSLKLIEKYNNNLNNVNVNYTYSKSLSKNKNIGLNGTKEKNNSHFVRIKNTKKNKKIDLLKTNINKSRPNNFPYSNININTNNINMINPNSNINSNNLHSIDNSSNAKLKCLTNKNTTNNSRKILPNKNFNHNNSIGNNICLTNMTNVHNLNFKCNKQLDNTNNCNTCSNPNIKSKVSAFASAKNKNHSGNHISFFSGQQCNNLRNLIKSNSKSLNLNKKISLIQNKDKFNKEWTNHKGVNNTYFNNSNNQKYTPKYTNFKKDALIKKDEDSIEKSNNLMKTKIKNNKAKQLNIFIENNNCNKETNVTEMVEKKIEKENLINRFSFISTIANHKLTSSDIKKIPKIHKISKITRTSTHIYPSQNTYHMTNIISNNNTISINNNCRRNQYSTRKYINNNSKRISLNSDSFNKNLFSDNKKPTFRNSIFSLSFLNPKNYIKKRINDLNNKSPYNTIAYRERKSTSKSTSHQKKKINKNSQNYFTSRNEQNKVNKKSKDKNYYNKNTYVNINLNKKYHNIIKGINSKSKSKGKNKKIDKFNLVYPNSKKYEIKSNDLYKESTVNCKKLEKNLLTIKPFNLKNDNYAKKINNYLSPRLNTQLKTINNNHLEKTKKDSGKLKKYLFLTIQQNDDDNFSRSKKMNTVSSERIKT